MKFPILFFVFVLLFSCMIDSESLVENPPVISSATEHSSSSGRTCEKYEGPVCSDNEQGELIQFSNFCAAEDAGISIFKLKECPGEGSSSTANSSSSQFILDCGSVYNPVCAQVDSQQKETYKNRCEAQKAGFFIVEEGICQTEQAPQCNYMGKLYKVNESFLTSSAKCTCRPSGVVCEQVTTGEFYFDNKSYLVLGDQCQVVDIECTQPLSFFSDSKGCGCAEKQDCPLSTQCDLNNMSLNYELCWGDLASKCLSTTRVFLSSFGDVELDQEEILFMEENRDLFIDNWEFIEPNLPLIIENADIIMANKEILEQNFDLIIPLLMGQNP